MNNYYGRPKQDFDDHFSSSDVTELVKMPMCIYYEGQAKSKLQVIKQCKD